MQDLAVNPEDAGARAVVRQRATAVAETFAYTANSINAIRNDFLGQIENTQREINSLLLQINTLNRQIGDAEPHGYVTNDLYDERDSLLDRLSSLVNIKTDRVQSGGRPDQVAEGKVNVWLTDNFGNKLDPPGMLVNANNYDALKGLQVSYDNGMITGVGTFGQIDENLGTELVTVDQFQSRGSFLAILEAYGYYDQQGQVQGVYPDMLSQLDEMAYRFATEFSKVHETGWSLKEISDGQKAAGGGVSFFQDTAKHQGMSGKLEFNEAEDKAGFASRIAISRDISESTNNIAAAGASNFVHTGMKFVPVFLGQEAPRTPPVVRGTFTGFGGNTNYQGVDSIKIDVKFENSSWHYSYNDNPFQPMSGTTQNLYGLTIDVTGLQYDPTNNFQWETHEITVGTRETASSGDGSNAQLLSNVKDTRFNFGGSQTNVLSFYRGVIGDMAVDISESRRISNNAVILRENVDARRDSISNVSIDEELTNMIKFQHAYNAAARNITLIDEMLDRIINGMGVVGR